MGDLYSVLLQGLTVSATALIILFVKFIFKDKLSPRWQYGIWIILAVRCLIPAEVQRAVILPFGFYLELLKKAELIPFKTAEIVFYVYLVGVLAFSSYYLFSYMKLRRVLENGDEPEAEELLKIKEVMRTKRIKPLKILYVSGVSSSFICGVFKPILVLPKGKEIDEKILLHEAEHLAHSDSLQSVFWCILKCINWYNPFMHFVFNSVLGDMEALCDQRVLEKLCGEERRDYGKLLLNEVNEKYPRMPATTTLSNGGRNIAKRIEAIVKFKLYPRGMALVSVLIALLITVPCFFVYASAFDFLDYYHPKNDYEFERALVASDVFRPRTVAAAIDTWAKAKIFNNGIYLLTASPKEERESIIEEMKKSSSFGELPIDIEAAENVYSSLYRVFNVSEKEEDLYNASLCFSIEGDWPDNKFNYEPYTLLVNVEIFKEEGSYVVREIGKRTVIESSIFEMEDSMDTDDVSEKILKLNGSEFYVKNMKGENGTLYAVSKSFIKVPKKEPTYIEKIFGDSNRSVIEDRLYLNNDFNSSETSVRFIYKYDGDIKKARNVQLNCLKLAFLNNPDEIDERFLVKSTGGGGGGGRSNWWMNEWEEIVNWSENYPWDGYIHGLKNNKMMDSLNFSGKDKMKISLYVDGKKVDEFIVCVEY